MEQHISSQMTQVQLHTFNNGTEVREHHLIIRVTDAARTLNYADQLRLVMETFENTRKQLAAKTVFKRYFLSDAANQADELKAQNMR